MKAITTKYLGQTNTRPARVKATDSDGNSITIGYDYGSRNPHREAAIALLEKMNWHGTLYGGHIKNGMVWVFVDDNNDRIDL